MMSCPECGGALRAYKTVGVSSSAIRRYRECRLCGARYSTYERLERKLDDAGKKEDAIHALTRWGVEPANAQAVAEKTPVNIVKKYSDNLPLLIMNYEDTTGVKVKDRAGFLVWSITQRRDIPKPSLNGNRHKLDEFGNEWLF